MAPKCNSDAGNFDMPERSHKVLPLSQKVKVLNLIRKKRGPLEGKLREGGVQQLKNLTLSTMLSTSVT